MSVMDKEAQQISQRILIIHLENLAKPRLLEEAFRSDGMKCLL